LIEPPEPLFGKYALGPYGTDRQTNGQTDGKTGVIRFRSLYYDGRRITRQNRVLQRNQLELFLHIFP